MRRELTNTEEVSISSSQEGRERVICAIHSEVEYRAREDEFPLKLDCWRKGFIYVNLWIVAHTYIYIYVEYAQYGNIFKTQKMRIFPKKNINNN